jgi:hypothetical protein
MTSASSQLEELEWIVKMRLCGVLWPGLGVCVLTTSQNTQQPRFWLLDSDFDLASTICVGFASSTKHRMIPRSYILLEVGCCRNIVSAPHTIHFYCGLSSSLLKPKIVSDNLFCS